MCWSYPQAKPYRLALVVYNIAMGKFVHLDGFTLNKIRQMHIQGYGYKAIAIETKITENVVRNRLGKTKTIVASNRPRGGTAKAKLERERARQYAHRYDHLLYEKINQGKNYAEYIKKQSNNKRISGTTNCVF